MLKKAIEQESTLALSNDTYAMAFKAFNWNVMTENDLRPDDIQGSFHAALFVFGIQLLMIAFLASVMFCTDGRYTFEISLPPDLSVLGARFVCTILMHL